MSQPVHEKPFSQYDKIFDVNVKVGIIENY